MFRVTLALVCWVALVPATPAHADERDRTSPPAFLNLTDATVLASPGAPKALASSLPRAWKPLTWPLPPEGPVLVLGLPTRDAAARTVLEALNLLEDPGHLRGGYAVWAWEAQDRPLVVVMAADPAALMAARFELRPRAPAGQGHPSMRTVDVSRPDDSSPVGVRAGQRRHRPAAALRGWAPVGPFTMPHAFACVGANINELWLTSPQLLAPDSQRALRRVRDLGLTVVWYEPQPVRDARTATRIGSLGVTRSAAQQVQATTPQATLDEHIDVGATKTHRAPLWYAHGTQAGVLDGWNRLRRTEPAYVPSVPANDRMEDAVLIGGPFELKRLAARWDRTRPVPDPPADVAACFGTSADPPTALRHAANALRKAATPWAAPIADALEGVATRKPLLVPVVPAAASIGADPKLDEPAWGFAARRDVGRISLRALSDGRALWIAVRRTDATHSARLTVAVRPLDRSSDAVLAQATPTTHALGVNDKGIVTARTYETLGGPAHPGRVVALRVGVADQVSAAVVVPLVVVP